MPYAICTECGQAMHWSNTRGSRIADMRCRCGGRLQAAQWQDGKIIARPRKASASAGRRYRLCVICKRRRLYTEVMDKPFRHEYWRDPWVSLTVKILKEEPDVYPAGSVVCSTCKRYVVPLSELEEAPS